MTCRVTVAKQSTVYFNNNQCVGIVLYNIIKLFVLMFKLETPQFILPDQTTPTSVWWHTPSVALACLACLPVVYSKYRRSEETSAGIELIYYCQ